MRGDGEPNSGAGELESGGGEVLDSDIETTNDR